MAYSTNPNLPKARATALSLLLKENIPVQVVANKCGVHRTTIYRWKLKWLQLNSDQQLENHNRPNRSSGRNTFRLQSCRWNIQTDSSKPHCSPKAIPGDVVTPVQAFRRKLKRCAEVVWYYLTHDEGISISLSSVRRILKRAGIIHGRKKRVRPDNPRRPHVTKPGELVETDTIHHVDPDSGKRLYYYTVIDLFTRMTHVMVVPKLGPGPAALQAQEAWSTPISMVQADNGPEYSRYFEQVMRTHGIATRHTGLHRPNDNAHIERFNRTIQTECIGYFRRRSVPLQHQRDTLTTYLDYYNNQRVHLGLQLRTPSTMLQRF